MTLFWNRLWAFLKSVPNAVWATLAALGAIAVLYAQRLIAEQQTLQAKNDKERADTARRSAEAKNVAIEHKTRATVAVEKANSISGERESIRNQTVKDLEVIEDLNDEEITKMMLRDAEEEAEKRKNKKDVKK